MGESCLAGCVGLSGGAGLSGAGGVETFGGDAGFGLSTVGGLAGGAGDGGFHGTVGIAAGVGFGAGLSWSGLFLAPGAITIGLLAGVCLGGTHSGDEVCIENDPEGSEGSSGDMSLRSDCNSLLSEESSSPIAAGDAGGDHDLAWYGPGAGLGELVDAAGAGLETFDVG